MKLSKIILEPSPDRIIRFLVRSSARTFQISLFGRPLLKFITKGKLSYPGHHSKITLEDFVMRLLLLVNDEAMVFLNPLTLDNMTYRRVDEIRKNMDHFMHIQNGAILLDPLKVKRI